MNNFLSSVFFCRPFFVWHSITQKKKCSAKHLTLDEEPDSGSMSQEFIIRAAIVRQLGCYFRRTHPLGLAVRATEGLLSGCLEMSFGGHVSTDGRESAR